MSNDALTIACPLCQAQPGERCVSTRGGNIGTLSARSHLPRLEALAFAVPGTSDGSTASYYELPQDATELQHLISHKDMNSQIGEIFRSAYRYGESSHSDKLRDAKKIRFYIEAEIDRLVALDAT